MPLKQSEIDKKERKFENEREQRLKSKSRRREMVEAYTRAAVFKPMQKETQK
jgi:hypothetical protein